MRLIVIPCSAKKLDHAAPARELYTGPLFRSALLAAEALVRAGRADHVMVLSAEHGLLELDQLVEPYDRKLEGEAPATYVVDLLDQLDGAELVSVLPLLPNAYAGALERALGLVNNRRRCGWSGGEQLGAPGELDEVELLDNPLAGSRGILEQRGRLRVLREAALTMLAAFGDEKRAEDVEDLPAPACWCGDPATYAVPVDPAITAATVTFEDGTPGLAVCDGHVDRDGYEALPAAQVVDPEPTEGELQAEIMARVTGSLSSTHSVARRNLETGELEVVSEDVHPGPEPYTAAELNALTSYTEELLPVAWPLHAHVETASRDCDGLYTGDYVLEPRGHDRDGLADVRFHERIVTSIASTYATEGGTLEVEALDGGAVRYSWREQTEEGFREAIATTCTREDCARDSSSFRDHTAEAAGY